ncbi:MAG: hypothetical protein ACPG49_00370 [Chitinophagales bacterium]
MRKVNWFFKRALFFTTIFIVFTACNKERFEFDENGDFVDQAGDFLEDYEGDDGSLTLYRINGNEITKTKDFKVKKKYRSFQEDVATHQAIWDYFTGLIPANARMEIVEFEIFHGEGDLLGYVAPLDDRDLSKWRMGLAIDAVQGNLNNINLNTDFTYTMIHELGHVLTLDHTQINVSINSGSCGAFHIDEGCSRPDSYINELFNIGWTDIIGEFNSLKNDNDIYDFYLDYEDRFVTEYAASNPAEDVAEVFAVFVTSNQVPKGNSIADQKVKAMYGHPELVKLRNEIRQSSTVRAMKAGSWKRPKCKHKHEHKHTVEAAY